MRMAQALSRRRKLPCCRTLRGAARFGCMAKINALAHRWRAPTVPSHGTAGTANRCCRRPAGCALLCPACILNGLTPAARALLDRLECKFRLDSTNAWLLRQPPSRAHRRVMLAECQSSGRGRNARRWLSPPGGGLYLSAGWLYPSPPAHISALSIACAVAATEALHALGLHGIGLKWPNDLMHRGRKAGGVLVETSPVPGNGCRIVVGIGLNIRLPERIRRQIHQPCTDLSRITGHSPPCINLLAAVLLNGLLPTLAEYPYADPARTAAAWKRHDCMRGKLMTLQLGDRSVQGRMIEIDADGLLLMKIDGVTQRFASGEISLRASS